jgi:excisionase family DNA binding protein
MVVTHSSLDALVTHLERLDAVAVVAMAEEAVGSGQAISEVIGSLLLPAWQQLDQRGGDGEMDEATIGAAATITRRALARAALVAGTGLVPSDRPSVMVVSSSTSADLLGADVVGELVTAAGWPVDVLSGSPAAEEIVAHVQLRRPAAVIVTFVETTDLPKAAGVIAGAHEAGIPVIAWGPAFGVDAVRSQRLGAEVWAPSLELITSTLEEWHQTPPTLVATPETPTGWTQVRAERAGLLRAATTISGWEPHASAWAERVADNILDHLGAAVLVGDERVLADYVEAERRGLVRNRLLDVHLLGLIDAVLGALSDTTQPAQAYVVASRDLLRTAVVSSRPRPVETDGGKVTVSSRPARALVGVPSGAPPAGVPDAPGAAHPGQPFTDILLLAALACQTPFAMVSVPQPGGQWSTLSYGFEHRDGLNDPRLFNYVAARSEPTEIRDLAAFPGLAGCSLATAPHNLRWVYAAPLRDASGTVLGVVAVLDRWLREASRREQRAMQAVTRQMLAHLSQRRKTPAPVAAPATSSWTAVTAVPNEPVPEGGGRSQRSSGLVGLRRAASLPDGQQLLRSHEVAVLFDVTERTVINWAAADKLPSLRTIGGHLRFHREDVLELLAGRTSGQRPAVGH